MGVPAPLRRDRAVYRLPVPSLISVQTTVRMFVTSVTMTVIVDVGLLLFGASAFREAPTVTTTGAQAPETFGLVARTTRGLPNSRTALMTDSNTDSSVVECMPGSPTCTETRYLSVLLTCVVLHSLRGTVRSVVKKTSTPQLANAYAATPVTEVSIMPPSKKLMPTLTVVRFPMTGETRLPHRHI